MRTSDHPLTVRVVYKCIMTSKVGVTHLFVGIYTKFVLLSKDEVKNWIRNPPPPFPLSSRSQAGYARCSSDELSSSSLLYARLRYLENTEVRYRYLLKINRKLLGDTKRFGAFLSGWTLNCCWFLDIVLQLQYEFINCSKYLSLELQRTEGSSPQFYPCIGL